MWLSDLIFISVSCVACYSIVVIFVFLFYAYRFHAPEGFIGVTNSNSLFNGSQLLLCAFVKLTHCGAAFLQLNAPISAHLDCQFENEFPATSYPRPPAEDFLY